MEQVLNLSFTCPVVVLYLFGGLFGYLFGSFYVKISVAQLPPLSQQQIAEETFQVNRSVIYPFDCIFVICSHKCIAKIP